MKNRFFVSTLVGATMLASCTNEVIEADLSQGNEINAQFSIGIPNQALTRAAFENPELDNLRLYMMVSYEGKIIHTETVEDWNANTPQTFSLRLVTGVEYQVSAWADYGEEYYTVTNAIGETPKVEMTDLELSGSDSKNDAYFITEDITFTTAGSSTDLVLRRPFGLVKISTTDIESPAVANAGLNPTAYKIATIDVPTSLDLLSGEAGDIETVSIDGAVATTESELSYDYYFASVTGDLINFSAEYLKGSETVVKYDFENVPVRRNFITNITGSILTHEGKVNISVDQAWIEPNQITIAGSDATYTSLNEAIKAVPEGGEIMLTSGEYNAPGLGANVNNKNFTISGPNKGISGTSEKRAPEAVIKGNVYRSPSQITKFTVAFDGLQFNDAINIEGGSCDVTIANSVFKTAGQHIGDNNRVVYVQKPQGKFIAEIPTTLTITNNLFECPEEKGSSELYIWGCKQDNSSVKATIEGNKFVRTEVALGDGGKEGFCVFNVDDNEFDSMKTGVQVSGGNDDTEYSITNNTFSNVSFAGIYVYGTAKNFLTMDGNTAAENVESLVQYHD